MNNQTKNAFAIAVTVGSLLWAQAASAATWNWSYFGTDVSASGTFTTTGDAATAEAILNISGQRNGVNITALVPLSASYDVRGNFFYDNLFTTSNHFFTEGGLLFDTGDATQKLSDLANVYSHNGQLYDLTWASHRVGDGFGTPVSFTVTAVPEPETYAMMMAGLGLVGFVSRRRRNKVVA